MTHNNPSCIPLEVRAAVYRRAVAQAYLDNCRETGVALTCNLTELEIACSMLGDMVQPTLLSDKPRLTVLGHIIMGELCQHVTAATLNTTLH